MQKEGAKAKRMTKLEMPSKHYHIITKSSFYKNGEEKAITYRLALPQEFFFILESMNSLNLNHTHNAASEPAFFNTLMLLHFHRRKINLKQCKMYAVLLGIIK